MTIVNDSLRVYKAAKFTNPCVCCKAKLKLGEPCVVDISLKRDNNWHIDCLPDEKEEELDEYNQSALDKIRRAKTFGDAPPAPRTPAAAPAEEEQIRIEDIALILRRLANHLDRLR